MYASGMTTDSIWMIVQQTRSDSDYRYGDIDETIDEDYGFYPTEEDAKAKADSLTGDRQAKYQVYVGYVESHNAAMKENYATVLRQREILKEAGEAVSDPPPREPKSPSPKSFDAWDKESFDTRYSVVEVKRGS